MITRAPWSTAQWIAADSASSEIVPSASTTFAIRSCAGKAIPAMPTPLSIEAAISPATKVPWPCSSVSALPPTKLFASAIRPANSGWPPSIPESITATRTAGSSGGSSQVSNARSWSRYHCSGASGSFVTNAAAAAGAASAATTIAATRTRLTGRSTAL